MKSVAALSTTSEKNLNSRRDVDALLITVAICTRNRIGFLEKAARSVLAQRTSTAELLIIDNASTDSTLEFASQLARENKNVRAIHEPELGLSAARNAALKNAWGKFVIFLDDDAVAVPGWLQFYENFLLAPPEENIVCVGGPVFPDFEKTPPRWLAPKCGVLDYGFPARELKNESGPWGGNVAYGKAVALKVGGFNTALGRKGKSLGAHEDLDLNLRLKTAGGKIWWLPEAAIKHFMPAQRLKLRWLLKTEMAEGSSSALMRLKNRTGAKRFGYILGRLIFSPVHCLYNLVVSLVMVPFQYQKKSVRALMRAARVTGFSLQLFRSALGG